MNWMHDNRGPRMRAARAESPALRIGGFTRLSCSDYPGFLSAVVFCQGCPWRCGYCHNPHLLAPRADTPITWHAVERFLLRRRGLLDAVVFSGGEPTAQPGLAAAMRAAKNMGFRIGLHTAGIFPRRLRALLPLCDWIGMDIKAGFSDYDATTGVRNSGDPAYASLQLVLASGVEHEFRTTVHPALLPRDALAALTRELARLGVRNYAVQEFRGPGRAPATPPATRGYLADSYCQSLAPLFHSFTVRRASVA